MCFNWRTYKFVAFFFPRMHDGDYIRFEFILRLRELLFEKEKIYE